MGLDPQQLAQTTVTTPLIDPSFVPMCPRCQYDLRGLPDGKCPECGEIFEHRAIEVAAQHTWAERVAYRSVSPDWLLLAMAVPTLIGLPAALTAASRNADVLLLWSALLWFGTAYWSWRGRWVIFRPSYLRLVWFIVPNLWTAVLLVSALSGLASITIIAPTLGVTWILFAWFRTRPRQLWILPAILAATTLPPAAVCVVGGGQRLLRGLTWSWVTDLRAGQIHRQYPLRNDELLYIGLISALPGVLLICMAFVCWYRRRGSNTQSAHCGTTRVDTTLLPAI